MNNFDFIAPIYDRLVQIFFGKNLDMATEHFFEEVGCEDNVLVIGGGTGRFLTQMPPCAGITYVEKSPAMIRKAKTRQVDSTIEFLESDFLTFESSKVFDLVICPFFLDCFNASNLNRAIEVIGDHLPEKGKLIVIDFQPVTRIWLINLMHLFFRVFAALESKRMKNIHHFVIQNRFSEVKEAFFHENMIFSRLYRNL